MLFLLLFLLIFLAGLLVLISWVSQRQKFGVLTQEKIYQDTELQPGKTLYAKSIPLIGKPDYLIKDKDQIFPVEVKTGKTPSSPYPNHKAQLMAYCLLVEENFGVAPNKGYIHYPDKEFEVTYTEQEKMALVRLVHEILECKASNRELHCKHAVHYVNE
jgi:CRISPR-associated exonuclease Cas4